MSQKVINFQRAFNHFFISVTVSDTPKTLSINYHSVKEWPILLLLLECILTALILDAGRELDFFLLPFSGCLAEWTEGQI